ncbi:MAG: phosphotransferase [Bacteroidaceae bacterium]|nr:phosphotransferase [Bacteroidaceae bacterium]
MDPQHSLIQLYQQHTGHTPVACLPITGSGSNRKYYRLRNDNDESIIGVWGASVEENRAFIYLAQHFANKKLPVPRVLATSEDGLCYLQNDLGEVSLFDAIRQGREAGGQYGKREIDLLRRTIAWLPRFQMEGAHGLDFTHCYPQPEMDVTNVLFDLNYFKYCFLKPSGADFHEMKLENDFRQMAEDLTDDRGTTFLYRDFQARNVMLDSKGNLWFIDFQGGRRGPVYYDVASFLWQASAHYTPTLRKELLEVYLQALQAYKAVDRDVFYRQLRLWVLFRLLQVLGAYGYRGYFERKNHFLQSIPPALDNLRAWLAEGASPYLHLNYVLKQLIATPESDHTLWYPEAPLCVRIFSFSYKKGIPADESGNGGGYVFDCRSTHNPGRYEPYKQLTGMDKPVIDFLEKDGEILTFLDSVYRLADAHIERYIQRGFTHLMFAFGCTGGQHRSVYSGQHLAEHIHQKYGIKVELIHREQNIRQTFLPQP